MTPATLLSTTGMLCSIGKSFSGSIYSIFWSIVTMLGFWKCFGLIIAVALWILYEIRTMGTHSYNSENGFTPMFNSFLGASVYFILQAIIYVVLDKIFGDGIYCFAWPYVLHMLVFLSTGYLLNILGIWKYWRVFGEKVRIKK